MRRTDREIINREEIESVIMAADVCRIAFAVDNEPYIVTMNFGYSGGSSPELYFHCAPAGRKLDMLRKNNFVCFEMDTDHVLYRGEKGCDWGMKFRSVVGYGRLYIIEGEAERKRALDHIMVHYGGSGSYEYSGSVMDSTTLLRLEITSLTGKTKK
jgi:hypothetical protein